MADNALEQVVDLELSERSSEEIACAYRALCAAILLRTAVISRTKPRPRKVDLDQKRTAVGWATDGRQGVLSFEACCEAVGYDPEVTREAIRRYAESTRSDPINTMKPERKRPRSRMVFGRKLYVRSRKTSPSAGVASCHPDAPSHRGSEAWPRSRS